MAAKPPHKQLDQSPHPAQLSPVESSVTQVTGTSRQDRLDEAEMIDLHCRIGLIGGTFRSLRTSLQPTPCLPPSPTSLCSIALASCLSSSLLV